MRSDAGEDEAVWGEKHYTIRQGPAGNSTLSRQLWLGGGSGRLTALAAGRPGRLAGRSGGQTLSACILIAVFLQCQPHPPGHEFDASVSTDAQCNKLAAHCLRRNR